MAKVYMKGNFFYCRPCLMRGVTKQQNRDIFVPHFFLRNKKKFTRIFFSASETGYVDLGLLHIAEHSYHINIESLSQRSPAWPRVLAHYSASGILLR